jgi:pimeloyl-ACP methyl ester carboxylesterase
MGEVAAVSGEPVSLIGHSLGGIYAREIARAAPEHVRRVITVGSPFGGDLKSNVVWPMYESITGTRIKRIPPEVLDRMNDPLPVPSTAIYSRSDGVVAWHSCIDEEAADAENIQVPGSHIGLLHNPATLYVIADRLAQAPGVHEPFSPPTWLRPFASRGPWRRRREGRTSR